MSFPSLVICPSFFVDKSGSNRQGSKQLLKRYFTFYYLTFVVMLKCHKTILNVSSPLKCHSHYFCHLFLVKALPMFLLRLQGDRDK